MKRAIAWIAILLLACAFAFPAAAEDSSFLDGNLVCVASHDVSGASDATVTNQSFGAMDERFTKPSSETISYQYSNKLLLVNTISDLNHLEVAAFWRRLSG